MIRHADEVATDEAAAGVAGGDVVGTDRVSSSGSPVREHFDGLFSAAVEGVLIGLRSTGDHRASNAAIGRALGVCAKRVDAIRAGNKWRPGDVMAMNAHPETRHAAAKMWSAVGALMAEAAPCVSMPPSKRLSLFVRELGPLGDEIARAEADDSVTHDERVAIASRYLDARRVGDEFVRASMLPPPMSGGVRKAAPREQAAKLGVANRKVG